MCGRYALTKLEDLERFLNSTAFEGPTRYNIAPTQPAPVVRLNQAGDRVTTTPTWGLVPFWAKDPAAVRRPINARAETVATSGMFRHAFARRRCLVPANGFYEWQARSDRRTKQPWYLHRHDHELFAFAGLCESWGEGEDRLDTFAIITTEPNELVRPIHDRMPVIVPPDEHDRWLDLATEPESLQPLLRPAPDHDWTADPVSTHVNRPDHDDASCIEPIEDPDRDLFSA
jgi:putative SOS response-associated peptidase YedK